MMFEKIDSAHVYRGCGMPTAKPTSYNNRARNSQG